MLDSRCDPEPTSKLKVLHEIYGAIAILLILRYACMRDDNVGWLGRSDSSVT